MTQSKNILFKKEYAEQLLKIALGDLETAKALIASPSPGRVENILYMIQQSVEKAIKAVLVKKQIAFPLVHEIGTLIALLKEKDYPPGGFDLTALNPYASVRRYEIGAIPVSKEELVSSYEAALRVMDWAKSH